MKSFKVILTTLPLWFAFHAWATGTPDCLAHGQPLPVNDQQVLSWKTSTPNEYHDRGHIEGTLTKIYSNHHGHHHFEVQIGPQTGDTIEVIYNEDFGPLPPLNIGETVEACGDYITEYMQAGPYPPSPDGAILHWVHQAPRPTHPSGFVMINGTLCGQNAPSK